MDRAKQAVSSFISKDGHHKTSVDEDVNRAVTEEQIRPHRHEEVTTAVDKEVHQDHHHTTIQPVKHQETLPEKHHHNIVPVAHKTFDHGNERETKDTLDREHAKFKDTSTTHETTHTSTTAPAVTGERVHHHIHEHIQPVIQKDTIQPHIVHTTIPIHETHHAKPIHHEATTLPVKTLEEFTREKGSLTDGPRHHRYDEFEGCPVKYHKDLGNAHQSGIGHSHDHSHGAGKAAVGTAAAGGAATTGRDNIAHNQTVGDKSITTAQGIMHGTHPTGTQTSGSNYTTSGSPTTATHGSSGLNKSEVSLAGAGKSSTTDHATHDATGKKISLVDKLNPFKDADGDGHKGIMS
ncbi:allergen [Colletotrichum lupini]|nr:allergen [Colletotrichum lupini]